MDMSTFSVQFANPLPVPDSPFAGINIDAEIKRLKAKLKRRDLDPAERDTDEQWLKDLEERSALEKKIKDLRSKTKETKKKDGEEAPPYDVSMDFDKSKLKKLEEEKQRKPNTPELSDQEWAIWKFFLPVSYCNAASSSNKLASIPHTLPYVLREKWTEYKRAESFKEFEIRASHPDVLPQRFALFGWRDTQCWLIAQWTGSLIQKPLSMDDIRAICLRDLKSIRKARMVRDCGTFALIPFTLWFGTLHIHPFVYWPVLLLSISLFLALLITWKNLDTELPPREEDELLSYLESTP